MLRLGGGAAAAGESVVHFLILPNALGRIGGSVAFGAFLLLLIPGAGGAVLGSATAAGRTRRCRADAAGIGWPAGAAGDARQAADVQPPGSVFSRPPPQVRAERMLPRACRRAGFRSDGAERALQAGREPRPWPRRTPRLGGRPGRGLESLGRLTHGADAPCAQGDELRCVGAGGGHGPTPRLALLDAGASRRQPFAGAWVLAERRAGLARRNGWCRKSARRGPVPAPDP